MSDPFALAADIRAEGYLCRWSVLALRELSAGNEALAELLVISRGNYGAVLVAGDRHEWVPACGAFEDIRAELVRVHVLPGAGPGIDPWGRERP